MMLFLSALVVVATVIVWQCRLLSALGQAATRARNAIEVKAPTSAETAMKADDFF